MKQTNALKEGLWQYFTVNEIIKKSASTHSPLGDVAVILNK